LEILEYCDTNDVIAREQYYIDLLIPEYNILKKAGSRIGHPHTDETRQKLSALQKGRIMSDETRAILSALQKGHIQSEETRAKRSDSNPKSVDIEVSDLETNITIYGSIREAAKELNTDHTSLRYCINTDKLFKGRYKVVKL
jgi:group I intron endonuclease